MLIYFLLVSRIQNTAHPSSSQLPDMFSLEEMLCEIQDGIERGQTDSRAELAAARAAQERLQEQVLELRLANKVSGVKIEIHQKLKPQMEQVLLRFLTRGNQFTIPNTHKPDQTKINIIGFDMAKSAAQLLYGPVLVSI